MDGDFCRMCKREVVDLTAMDDAARLAFFQTCESEVCVTYKAPARIALAAMAVSAMMAVPVAAAASDTSQMGIVVGGMKNPAHVELVKDAPEDTATPDLPVVYETTSNGGSAARPAAASQTLPDTQPAPEKAQGGAKTIAASVSRPAAT